MQVSTMDQAVRHYVINTLCGMDPCAACADAAQAHGVPTHMLQAELTTLGIFSRWTIPA